MSPNEERSAFGISRSELNRRTLLKTLGIGAAGLAGVPLLAACTGGSGPAGGGSARHQVRPDVRLRCLRRSAQGRVQGGDGCVHQEIGHPVATNVVPPQRLPEQDQHLPAGQPGRRLHLVRRLPHAVLRRQGAAGADRRRLGQDRRQLLRRAEEGLHRRRTARSTSSRTTTTRGASSTGRACGRTRATRSRQPSTTSRPWPPR